MRTVDHIILARLIQDRYMKNIPKKFRRAFYFGCIEPDYNPFSYLHGFFRNFNLYGHNFNNVQYFIKSLFIRLNNSEKRNCLFFFRLGLLIHYVTDSFTHAHSSVFSGSLKEHQMYEQRLHLLFKRLAENHLIYFSENLLPCGDIGYVSRLYKIYIKSDVSVLNDLKFILSLSSSIMKNFDVFFREFNIINNNTLPISETSAS